MKEHKLLVGLDLCNDYTQICVYDPVTHLPFEEERFPTVLSYRKRNNTWSFGDLAMAGLEEKDILLHHFIDKMANQEAIVVLEKEADNQKLLSYYLRKVLNLLKKNHPTDTIKKLVVTVPSLSDEYEALLYRVMEELNILKDRVEIIPHQQSFVYFVMNQEREIWSNDVGLFDFSDRGLQYVQMRCDRQKEPYLVGLTYKDLSADLKLSDLQGEHSSEQLAYAFDVLSQGAIHRQILSALYITGKGFEGDWASDIMEKLSVGRRTFYGTNLFLYGACYCAHESGSSFVYLDERRAPFSISMNVYKDGKVSERVLVQPGIPWEKINETLDVITDGDEEIEFTIKDVVHRTEHRHILVLDGIKGRTERMCRLSIYITFTNVNICVIKVKDKGFGEIFPSANRIWEETFTLTVEKGE